MKLFVVVVCCIVSSVLAAPQGDPNDVQIIRSIYEPKGENGFDGYRYTYELTDGTIRSEDAGFKEIIDVDGNTIRVLVVQGAVSYVAPDGETYWLNYSSDDTGYKPKTGKGKLGGIKPGEDAAIDPNLLKSLIG